MTDILTDILIDSPDFIAPIPPKVEGLRNMIVGR